MKYQVEAEQINIFDERWYEIKVGSDVKYFRSVTTFLEAFPMDYGLTEWLKMTGYNSEIIVERSAEFGSRFHEMVEGLLRGETVEYKEGMDIQLWERIMRWMDFWKELNEQGVTYKPDFIEFITYDTEYEYAGTVDFLCRIGGKVCIVDWKTSNYLQDKHELQIAAYTKAIEKQFNIKVDKAFIGWFPHKKPNKKGYRLVEVTDLDDKFRQFLTIRDSYLIKHKNEKPKYKTYPTKITLED